MTEQETIELLKKATSIIPMSQTKYNQFIDAVNMGIDALEKQLPKKLFGNKHNPVIVGDTVSGLCPKCLTEFVCITPRLYAEKGLGYCKECGQRLDWSDI